MYHDLTPQQYLAAKMLGAGTPVKEAAEKVHVTSSRVSAWKKLPQFTRVMARATVDQEGIMRMMLLDGEHRAAAVLFDALDAVSPTGNPLWNVRLTAATELLDRAGIRGKVAARSIVGITPIGDVDQAVRSALSDPGVRDWINSSPKLLSRVLEVSGEARIQSISERHDGRSPGDDGPVSPECLRPVDDPREAPAAGVCADGGAGESGDAERSGEERAA